MNTENKHNITIFYCTNALPEDLVLSDDKVVVKKIKMSCSSMTRDIYLLKAFESGADAVMVFTCPEQECRFIEGGIRAKKRVNYVKGILDEIGMDGKRLSIHNVGAKNADDIHTIINECKEMLIQIGHNPAA